MSPNSRSDHKHHCPLCDTISNCYDVDCKLPYEQACDNCLLGDPDENEEDDGIPSDSEDDTDYENPWD